MREFWAKNKKGIFIGMIILFTVVILVLVLGDDDPPDVKAVEGGGIIPEGWTPISEAKELFEVMDGILDTGWAKSAAYGRFNALNDNQIIAVYNYWNKKYSKKRSWIGMKFGTLTEAMTDEYTDVPEYFKALARLQALRLP